ncbi:hypothetical protein DNTS_014477 [Danionella cerebrum]|uniref:5-demethoxyubiquinone hydroxylase, mitochondrial n=1 Tax=Danionella cerebrum TaxID=2873325 RepID=A0A553PVB6_9TELE|nr:hypothetical protein DNTS_014477 [Danionella translucida]
MQTALRCAARLELSRVIGGNASMFCRRYSVLPPLLDEEEKAMLDSMLRVDHAGEYGANRIYAGQMAVLGRTQTGPLIQHMWDQEKIHLEKFNEILGEHRVRPTLMLPLWDIAGFALGACSALLGKEGAMACTVAVEESISEHYNSQIRTLMEADPERYTDYSLAPSHLHLKSQPVPNNVDELYVASTPLVHPVFDPSMSFRVQALQISTLCTSANSAPIPGHSLRASPKTHPSGLTSDLPVRQYQLYPIILIIKEFRDDEMEHHDTGLEHDAESAPGYFLMKTAIQAGCKAAIYVSERI